MDDGLAGGDNLAFLVSAFVFVLTDGVFSRLVATGELESNLPRFASFLTLSAIFLYPLSILLDWIAGLFIKPTVELAAKEEALREYVKSESELGVIEEEEGEMIQSILAFADTTAREVMVPRIDVVAADIATPVDELISLFKSAGHSRIPCMMGGSTISRGFSTQRTSSSRSRKKAGRGYRRRPPCGSLILFPRRKRFQTPERSPSGEGSSRHRGG